MYLFFQIALIAINVIGQELPPSSDGDRPDCSSRNNAEDTDNLQLTSICDDLSFSMYVEENITETVREMELKKTLAVNGKT